MSETPTDTERTHLLPVIDMSEPDNDELEGPQPPADADPAANPAGAEPIHILADLWVGGMGHDLVDDEFDAVLSLGKDAGHIPDSMRHRHIPIGTHTLDATKLTKATTWVHTQWKADRSVLVRCDYEIERAALVVGLVCIQMGGTGYDALLTLGRAGVCIDDFRYRRYLTDAGKVNHDEALPIV